MKNWIKENWFKIGLLAIIVIFISSAFYWYAYRPSRIRHDCSWTARHAEPWAEVTQSQYDACINRCDDRVYGNNMFDTRSWCYGACTNPHPYRPAIDWWEEANKDEYNFCIHEKGL